MAEKKIPDLEEEKVIEEAIAAEFQKNDDIVEYIQPSSLEMLKAKYGEAEEDETIRNEGFELVEKSGLINKPKPDDVYGYYYAPQGLKKQDDIQNEEIDDVTPLAQMFETAMSEFDADSISFGEIDLDSHTTAEAELSIEGEAENNKEKEDSKEEDFASRSDSFDTHTKVVFNDADADDGIKRNTDDEVISAFTSDDSGKTKGLLRRFRHGK